MMQAIPHDGMLHIIENLSDENFSLIGPRTAALISQGVAQTVILNDDPASSHLIPQFHPLVKVVSLPCQSGSISKLRMTARVMKHFAASKSIATIHSHGFLPTIAVLASTRFLRIKPMVYVSFHGARTESSWSKATFRQLVKVAHWVSAVPVRLAIESRASDAVELRSFLDVQTSVVGNSLDPAFFNAKQDPTKTPVVSMASRKGNRVAASLFSQLAVLLNGNTPPMVCRLLGSTDNESSDRLHASGVEILEAGDPKLRARHLSSTWIFVEFGGSKGFPIFLAEAMAAGLPCIAWNTAEHRDLIQHESTGLLCDSHDQMLAYVANLIESPERRLKLGKAARHQAASRFDITTQKGTVVPAYS